jgi:cytochrome c-type biogenesis protein CcmH/NrfG
LPVLLPLLLTLPIIPLLVASGGEVSTTGNLVQSRLDIPRLHYLLTQLPVLVTYLRLLFWPAGQNLDYDYPVFTSLATPAVIGSLIILLGLAALAVWLYWKSRPTGNGLDALWRLVSGGICWFFLTMAVESSVVPLPDVIFEHRLYLPLAGLALAVAAIVVLLSAHSRAILGGRLPLLVAVTAIFALAVATWQRNQVWQSELSLWADTASKSPRKARPLYNYGYYLTEAGRVEEAIAVLSRAVAADPRYADAWHNLGRAYLLLGRNDEALPALRTAVRLAPGMDNSVLNLSSALLRTGKPAEALPLLQAVSDRSPDWPEVRFSLGLAALGTGDLQAAQVELTVLQRLGSPLATTLADLIRRADSR